MHQLNQALQMTNPATAHHRFVINPTTDEKKSNSTTSKLKSNKTPNE